jgi:hypothetical protein
MMEYAIFIAMVIVTIGFAWLWLIEQKKKRKRKEARRKNKCMSLFLARNGHAEVSWRCPLLGEQRKTYARMELFRF